MRLRFATCRLRSSPKQAEQKWGEKVNQALASFKLTSFREGQRDIIMSIVGGTKLCRLLNSSHEGHDTMVLMPTGANIASDAVGTYD